MKEKEKLKRIRNCKATTEEIESDIKDWQKEIDQIKLEIDTMLKNKAVNRKDIYIRTGAVLHRQETINFLKEILEYRKMNN